MQAKKKMSYSGGIIISRAALTLSAVSPSLASRPHMSWCLDRCRERTKAAPIASAQRNTLEDLFKHKEPMNKFSGEMEE